MLLNIIYANEGKLYNFRKAYAEMSKLYYIYQLYKNGTISSKYIGVNHYSRYFNFTDNIPDMDSIFNIVFSRALWYDKAIWAGEIR